MAADQGQSDKETQNLYAFNNGELGPELRHRIDLARYYSSVDIARNLITQKFGGQKMRPGMRYLRRVRMDQLRSWAGGSLRAEEIPDGGFGVPVKFFKLGSSIREVFLHITDRGYLIVDFSDSTPPRLVRFSIGSYDPVESPLKTNVIPIGDDLLIVSPGRSPRVLRGVFAEGNITYIGFTNSLFDIWNSSALFDSLTVDNPKELFVYTQGSAPPASNPRRDNNHKYLLRGVKGDQEETVVYKVMALTRKPIDGTWEIASTIRSSPPPPVAALLTIRPGFVYPYTDQGNSTIRGTLFFDRVETVDSQRTYYFRFPGGESFSEGEHIDLYTSVIDGNRSGESGLSGGGPRTILSTANRIEITSPAPRPGLSFDFFKVYKESSLGNFALLGFMQNVEGAPALVDSGQSLDTTDVISLPLIPALTAWNGGAITGQRLALFRDREVLLSRLGEFTSIFESLAIDARSGFSFKIPENDQINFIVGGHETVLGLGEKESLIGQQGVLSPTAIQKRDTSFEGSSPNVAPVVVDNGIVFLHKNEKTIIYLRYDRNYDGQIADDLTLYSPERFAEKDIRGLAVVKDTSRVVFVLTADGELHSVTVDEREQVKAWNRHDTKGKVLWIESESNKLFLLVERKTGPASSDVAYFMEEMAFNNIKGLDCYISGDEEIADAELAILKSVYRQGAAVLGLDTGVIASIQDDNLKTSNLESTEANTGTSRLNLGMTISIIIGLPYEAEFKTLPLDVVDVEKGLRSQKVNVRRVTLNTLNTPGFQVVNPDGSVVDNTYRILGKSPEAEELGRFISPKNFQQKVPVKGKWANGQVTIMQRRPMELHILGISLEGSIERG